MGSCRLLWEGGWDNDVLRCCIGGESTKNGCIMAMSELLAGSLAGALDLPAELASC